MLIGKKRISGNKIGDAGISASIILTSLLLVSGAAASTIIGVNNQYQEQSELTADQALASVATGLDVVDIIGHWDGSSIYSLDLLVRLSYGSPSINLSHLTIVFVAADDVITYTLNSTQVEDRFALQQVNIVSNNGAWVKGSDDRIIDSGDLVRISLNGMDVGANQQGAIQLIPAQGQTGFVMFMVPDNILGSVVSLS